MDQPTSNLPDVFYRLDDQTLEIDECDWEHVTRSAPDAAITRELFEMMMRDNPAKVYPGAKFEGYYHTDPRLLEQMAGAIRKVRDYADKQKSLKKPCYLSDVAQMTDLEPLIIQHILNVRRGRAPY